jgi:hypothetical protein
MMVEKTYTVETSSLYKNAIAESAGKQIADQITGLIADGIVHREVMRVLMDTCFIPKHLMLFKRDDERWHVYHRDINIGLGKGNLFSHVSLAACVEFALKYEDKDSPDKAE